MMGTRDLTLETPRLRYLGNGRHSISIHKIMHLPSRCIYSFGHAPVGYLQHVYV